MADGRWFLCWLSVLSAVRSPEAGSRRVQLDVSKPRWPDRGRVRPAVYSACCLWKPPYGGSGASREHACRGAIYWGAGNAHWFSWGDLSVCCCKRGTSGVRGEEAKCAFSQARQTKVVAGLINQARSMCLFLPPPPPPHFFLLRPRGDGGEG